MRASLARHDINRMPHGDLSEFDFELGQCGMARVRRVVMVDGHATGGVVPSANRFFALFAIGGASARAITYRQGMLPCTR